MTYRHHRNKCEKQMLLYIAFVSQTTGKESLAILDEITRLRYTVSRIDRMTESESLQQMNTTKHTIESALNNEEITLI